MFLFVFFEIFKIFFNYDILKVKICFGIFRILYNMSVAIFFKKCDFFCMVWGLRMVMYYGF